MLFRSRSVFNERSTVYEHLHELIDATQKAGLSGEVVFIDVTAERTPEMFELHRVIVEQRQKMVTANKNPLAQEGAHTFEHLTADRMLYRYNASVMAGGDAVRYLQEARDLSEPVRSISGCFSGTLGYICSELQKDRPFSEIVREAKEQGYTEPHPWDDLNGFDVARKLLILARSAGLEMDMNDITVEPFIPRHYGDITDALPFLESLRAEDEAFRSKVQEARSRDAVLRARSSPVREDDAAPARWRNLRGGGGGSLGGESLRAVREPERRTVRARLDLARGAAAPLGGGLARGGGAVRRHLRDAALLPDAHVRPDGRHDALGVLREQGCCFLGRARGWRRRWRRRSAPTSTGASTS